MKLEKRKVENKKAQRLNMKFRQQRIVMWKSVKSIRKKDIKPQIDLDTLVAYYTEQLNTSNARPENEFFDKECREQTESAIRRIKASKGDYKMSVMRIKRIMEKLKNNKAPGPLKGTNEMLKYLKKNTVASIIINEHVYYAKKYERWHPNGFNQKLQRRPDQYGQYTADHSVGHNSNNF